MEKADIMASGAGMSPRKAIASGMGEGSGTFGAKQMNGGVAIHPDKTAKTGSKPAMADGSRGIGDPIMHTKGQMPAQAAPSHGPTHPGGHGNHRGYSNKL